ncbi:leucine-rich repeat domain-containing protein [Legionella sp. 227]|uniref:leucine-rich repeat domain-containing protein n=1 Tax=Legionella sp. 227 TaxID=3367288 RepID=UPI00370DCB1F
MIERNGFLIEVLNEDLQSDGTITLPAGLKSICGSAFNHCKSLAAITLPEGLNSIGGFAFAYCTSLTTITLPAGLNSISPSTFSGCTNLTTITLPAGLNLIGASAFNRCTSLAAITLPEGLKLIDGFAFAGCTSLTTITLPAGLNSIGICAFSGCNQLEQIVIDTDDFKEYTRIKELLPKDLQIKVPYWGCLEAIKEIQTQCLQKLINQPETNFLYQELQLGAHCNPFFYNFPNEMIVEINNHMKSDNWYYAKALKELTALSMPHSEENLERYREQCDEIVTKYINIAQTRAENFAKGATKEKEQGHQALGFFAIKQERFELEVVKPDKTSIYTHSS